MGGTEGPGRRPGRVGVRRQAGPGRRRGVLGWGAPVGGSPPVRKGGVNRYLYYGIGPGDYGPGPEIGPQVLRLRTAPGTVIVRSSAIDSGGAGGEYPVSPAGWHRVPNLALPREKCRRPPPDLLYLMVKVTYTLHARESISDWSESGKNSLQSVEDTDT